MSPKSLQQFSQMWSISNSFANRRLQRVSTETNLCYGELSDDDGLSSSSNDDGLESLILWRICPIFYGAAFAVPKLCNWASVGCLQTSCAIDSAFIFSFLPMVQLFITTVGRNNYFILWMIESLNGERANSEFSLRYGSQLHMSPGRCSILGCCSDNNSLRRIGSNFGVSHVTSYANLERPQFFPLHNSLDHFIHFAAKFSLALNFFGDYFPCSWKFIHLGTLLANHCSFSSTVFYGVDFCIPYIGLVIQRNHQLR